MILNTIKKAIKSSYLCLKYPFLYPRNRFTGRHYTNWDFEHYINLFNSISKDTCWITFKEGEKGKASYNKATTINGNHYIIGRNMKGFYIGPLGKPMISLKDALLEGNIVDYEWNNGNAIFYCTPGFIVAENFQRFVVLKEDKKIKFLIGCLTKLYDFISLFHCIPTYTELDALDKGWRKKFGNDICKDIKKQLKKEGKLKDYRIVQIKEKFGGLRWYDNESSKELNAIIHKYEELSYITCGCCGNPAKYVTGGWIYPYCEKCFPKNHKVYAEIINGKWKYADETKNC